MNILSRVKLGSKLASLLGLSALALVASIGVGASLVHQRMIDDRIDKLHGVVLAAAGFAQSLQAQVDAHQISREQALATFRDDVHRVRFGSEGDYLVVQSLDGLVVMHGGEPAREGTPTASRDASGRSTAQLAREVLSAADGGVIWYSALKPGSTTSQAKVSYVARFAPWQMVFIAGAWMDDVDAAYRDSLLRLGSIGGMILAITVIAAWLVNRDITRSLGSLKAAMEQLAQGDLAIRVPGTSRRDEVGGMAQAALVFKDQMVKRQLLEAAAAAERATRERQHAAMERHTQDFGDSVSNVLASLGTSAKAMREAADCMAHAVEQTRASSTATAAGAEESSHNLAGVAAATEELTASVDEIARQVAQAAQAARDSVERANATGATVRGLSEAVGQIGDVTRLIAGIAGQTNLLALNATIEAARAGEAGKGFAVVAAEVKLLATQTARATEKISAQITAIQAAAGDAVTAVNGVGEAIMRMDEVASAIAAAVEEQGAATREIAASVQAVSRQNKDATRAMREVSNVAGNASGASQAVLVTGDEVARVSGSLQQEVADFFAAMRAAESERRRWERIPGGGARISLKPRHGDDVLGELDDISRGGTLVVCAATFDVGAEVEVRLSGAADAVPARVARTDGHTVALLFRQDPGSLARIDRAMEAIGVASAPVQQSVRPESVRPAA